MATTFAAGATITLSLDADDTITWVGSGDMTVTPATGPKWGVHLEGSQTYGPFGQSVSVSIVTTTNGSYTHNGYFADNGAPVFASPNLTGVIKNFIVAGIPVSMPQHFAFPDFAPSIVATLVAGSMAAQSGNTVTVTATSHGLPSNKDGYKFYYPGSPSISAGWYSGFARTGANTFTFTNPVSQTVGSESVNAGAVYTGQPTICSATIPAGSIGKSGAVEVKTSRFGDTIASNKSIKLFLGSTQLGVTTATALPAGTMELGFYNVNNEAKQIGIGLQSGTNVANQFEGVIDTSANQTLSLVASLSVASQWMTVEYAEYEIKRRA